MTLCYGFLFTDGKIETCWGEVFNITQLRVPEHEKESCGSDSKGI